MRSRLGPGRLAIPPLAPITAAPTSATPAALAAPTPSTFRSLLLGRRRLLHRLLSHLGLDHLSAEFEQVGFAALDELDHIGVMRLPQQSLEPGPLENRIIRAPGALDHSLADLFSIAGLFPDGAELEQRAP